MCIAESPRSTLHLALLIHDLGKGYVEDHSEVGARIAVDVGRRLRLPERETETLRLLVHKHLVMSHLAFRRDTSDEQVILRFAVDVGSPEVLRMLFVLTAADLAAVGPGVLNDWKLEVLSDLYQRTMLHLSGETPSAVTERRRGALQALLQGEPSYDRLGEQIRTLPSSYLHSAPPERIAEDLRQLATLRDGEVKTWCRYLPETRTVEYTVVHAREHYARRFSQADRRPFQPGAGDTFGRHQHAGGRVGARSVHRTRPGFYGRAARGAN